MSRERIKNTLFVLAHPVKAVRTKSRQIAVSIEAAQPPSTSTWEEFPNLSIREAAETMRPARSPIYGSGVPKEAWSQEDQERMERGELPKGRPLHPNV
jgi:hypothetical protein